MNGYRSLVKRSGGSIASPSPCPGGVGVVRNERIHAGSVVLEAFQRRDLVALRSHRLDERVSDLCGRRCAAEDVAKRGGGGGPRGRVGDHAGGGRLLLPRARRAAFRSGAR